jgi:hypothetical protein
MSTTYEVTYGGKTFTKTGHKVAYTHALVRVTDGVAWVTSWHTSKGAAEKRLAGWSDATLVEVRRAKK